MSKFIKSLRRRLERGIRLSDEEQASIDAVLERMRHAIRKGRGIRLSKDELRVLGLQGLKDQFDKELFASRTPEAPPDDKV